MPLFDVRCEACGRVSEVLARAGDDVACPACGGATQRCISRPNAPGTSRTVAGAARAAARREGHLSNF